MADPFTWIGIGTAVVGGITGAVGAESAGQAKSSAALYQAGVAGINTKVATQNADYMRETGEIDARRSGLKTADAIARTRVAQSGSGVDINSGSPAAVTESEHAIGVEDQATIRNNAARRAYGFDVQAESERQKGVMDVAEASNARKAGGLGALTSILGAAASVSSKWSQAKQAGIGSGEDDPWAGLREVTA